mmetsp:Transcript_7546/g.11416  ORF Transcript_7546/g.11416 Transcript_7546/m.11416 type:complete len:347 (-) Transcript_7546:354-1394(-)|eukprot:CAMPEP_0195290338 /NCGR_PEP_ID=MMETSP0707-20130614/6241_1 /TAXON_ID=33640 /ORGANISM="Asterionellopsis glacialis, Strain CCMP134" /LENGTH=346 /DNA_ID=CAMNT_0040350453 /DNA_START=148 /DNA_END=1188 /DNA_ORIENTATION=-
MKFVSLFTTGLLCGQQVGAFVGPSRSSSFVTKTLHSRSWITRSTSSTSTPSFILRLADVAEDIPTDAKKSRSPEEDDSMNENVNFLATEDPIGLLFKEAQMMDINAIINSAALIAVVLAVMTTFTTVDSNIMRGWSVEEMAYRIPFDNWEAYSAVLARSPVETKAVTSATVYTIGDIISQFTEGATIGTLDRMRILRSLLAGLIGHGPLSHVWYNWSDDIFENVFHWTEWWSFFPKVLVDQSTWGPFWNNTYILLLGLMKFESLESIWGDMKRTTIPLIVSGLKLWPLAHCVTYGLVPVENRLLWVDLVEIIWVTILATQASGAPATEAHAAEAEEKEQVEAAAKA